MGTCNSILRFWSRPPFRDLVFQSSPPRTPTHPKAPTYVYGGNFVFAVLLPTRLPTIGPHRYLDLVQILAFHPSSLAKAFFLRHQISPPRAVAERSHTCNSFWLLLSLLKLTPKVSGILFCLYTTLLLLYVLTMPFVHTYVFKGAPIGLISASI